MTKFDYYKNDSVISQWQEKIKIANRNNIFCHCRNCNYEWVDSSFDATCSNCGSVNIEGISCWHPDG